MVESDQIFQKRKKIVSHVKVAANRVLSSYFIVCGCRLSSCDLSVDSYFVHHSASLNQYNFYVPSSLDEPDVLLLSSESTILT
jgi:hypothetical protein